MRHISLWLLCLCLVAIIALLVYNSHQIQKLDHEQNQIDDKYHQQGKYIFHLETDNSELQKRVNKLEGNQ